MMLRYSIAVPSPMPRPIDGLRRHARCDRALLATSSVESSSEVDA